MSYGVGAGLNENGRENENSQVSNLNEAYSVGNPMPILVKDDIILEAYSLSEAGAETMSELSIVQFEDNLASPGTSNGTAIRVTDPAPQFALTKSVKNDHPNQERSQSESFISKNIIQIRPRHMKVPKKPVPDDEKDQLYFDKRQKNTLSARRCREKKRELDEKRVSMIKQLMAENEELREKIAKLSKEVANNDTLKDENTLLKQMVQRMLN